MSDFERGRKDSVSRLGTKKQGRTKVSEFAKRVIMLDSTGGEDFGGAWRESTSLASVGSCNVWVWRQTCKAGNFPLWKMGRFLSTMDLFQCQPAISLIVPTLLSSLVWATV
ncbi:hypothetical protein FOPE_12665 [Fonsecaea pedrosoi]|nr:hypothetical protein FOPE_12665 [Fonsecaea pedrosoi]